MYGSQRFVPSRLDPNSIGHPIKKSVHRSGWTSFFRIMIVVAEVGLSLLTADPFVGIGIGLAGAAANTGLSAATGSLSGIGIGIDFGAALLPGIGAARYGYKLGKVAKSAETASLVKLIEKESINGVKSATSKELFNLGKSSRKTYLRGKSLVGSGEKGLLKAQQFAERIASGKLNRIDKLLFDVVGSEENVIKANFKYGKSQLSKMNYGNDILEKLRKRLEYERLFGKISRELEIKDAIKQAEELTEAFEQIKNFPISKRVSQSAFLKHAEKLVGTEKRALLKQMYIKPLNKSKLVANKTLRALSADKLEQTLKTVSKETRDNFYGLLKHVQYTQKFRFGGITSAMNSKEIGRAIDAMLEATKITSPRDYDTLISALGKDGFKNLFKPFAVGSETTGTRMWVKKIGSKRFNDKVVQVAQLIDPNDVGRYPVEQAYQYLKRKIDKKIEQQVYKKGWKKAGVLVKKVSTLEGSFVAAGGHLLPTNRYILGIKVLPGGKSTHRLVFVKFNKLSTMSTKKGSHLRNGKKDMLVSMSDIDIKNLIEYGTPYWFAKGRKKGWFRTKGGRKVSGELVSAVTNKMSLFLGFVPIPALRNVLSIISNWVENINDIATGNYFGQWFKKFSRAFERSTVNRSARLLTRVVIGGHAIRRAKLKGAIKGAEQALEKGLTKNSASYNAFIRTVIDKSGKKGAWVGRELQRFSTNTLSTFEGTDKNGNFRFTNGSNKNHSGGYNLGKKLLFTGAPTSLRGALIRHGTNIHKTGGKKLVGARRNFGQIGRIFGAVTPAGSVKPLRSITRIK